MGRTTPIEYCDSTVNPTEGCDGCELWSKAAGGICYAAKIHARYNDGRLVIGTKNNERNTNRAQ